MDDNKEKALGFDDVLLLPAAESEIKSRKEVDTSTKISHNNTIKYPIIASPMDTISGVDTCVALNKIGAAGILHRFMSIEEQINQATEIKNRSGKCYIAIGLKDYKERVLDLVNNVSPNMLVLDTANINTPLVKDFMNWYKHYSYMPDIMMGNTLTTESVNRAFELGASSVRHGIGTGLVCTTTDMTGIGCPPITTLYYGWKAMDFYPNKYLILDGGIRKPADLVKAIIFGADAVMCGGIFAGYKDTPGKPYYKTTDKERKIIKNEVFSNSWYGEHNKLYKDFRGMASYETLEKYNLSDGTQENLFVEGKEIEVQYINESVTSVVYKYVNGLRSALSYLGFNSLQEAKGSFWTGQTKGIIK